MQAYTRTAMNQEPAIHLAKWCNINSVEYLKQSNNKI